MLARGICCEDGRNAVHTYFGFVCLCVTTVVATFTSLQMTKGVHTVVVLVIGSPTVPSWKVCNKRKPVACQGEISWLNQQPITNS